MSDSKKTVIVGNVAGNINLGDSPEYQVGSAINELLISLTSSDIILPIKSRRPSSETIIKIQHNNLESKSFIIKQYLDHSSKVEEAYQDIESKIPFGKNTILNNLNGMYYAALDTVGIKYLANTINIKEVRENADFILDFIITNLKKNVFESNNTPNLKEHIELGVNVIVAHAFIECIIMENPNNDT